MTKRYEFAGTHYSRNKSVMAAAGVDDGIIVMYVNQEKIYEGDLNGLQDGIADWLKSSNATVSNKYSLVDWCNSWGDPMYPETDELPADDDLADTVAWLIEGYYKDTPNPDRDFYLDGSEYLNMEIFPKAQEVE